MRLTVFNRGTPITSDLDLTVRFLENLVGLRKSYYQPNPDSEGKSIVGIGDQEYADFLRYLALPIVGHGLWEAAHPAHRDGG